MFHRKPDPIIVWTSEKTSAEKAAKELAKERVRLAKKGYALEDQTWAPEGRGLISTVVKGAIFLPLAITGGGKGKLVATFVLQ